MACAMQISCLIHDLLVVETWREKVFPLMIGDLSHLAAVKAYIVVRLTFTAAVASCPTPNYTCMPTQLYHEATVCNLLEVLLFHENVCASADEAMSELVDYCYRRNVQLNSGYAVR